MKVRLANIHFRILTFILKKTIEQHTQKLCLFNFKKKTTLLLQVCKTQFIFSFFSHNNYNDSWQNYFIKYKNYTLRLNFLIIRLNQIFLYAIKNLFIIPRLLTF